MAKFHLDVTLPFGDSLNLSLFNSTEEDKQKATEAYKLCFGNEAFETIIQPLIKDGIMGILDEDPTEDTIIFVVLLVNHLKLRKYKASEELA